MQLNSRGSSVEKIGSRPKCTAEALPLLPAEGFVRLSRVISPNGPIPVSKSTWWAGVKSGRFPQPVRFLGPGITAWRVEDIRRLISGEE